MTINKEIFEKLAEKYDKRYMTVNPRSSYISFEFQNGPIKEVGINGVQIEMLGEVWLEILQGFNEKFPCEENKDTIFHIRKALSCQRKRKADREKRNVEGYNKL